mgnify:CR=1 FL=1
MQSLTGKSFGRCHKHFITRKKAEVSDNLQIIRQLLDIIWWGRRVHEGEKDRIRG